MWSLLPPLIAGIVAQLIKFVMEAGRGKFSWHQLTNYGGMPSAHSAFVVGLATEVFLLNGPQSTTFAITVILALIIIRDATGYRQEISEHAKAINRLAEAADHQAQILPHLKEKIGHRPLEALVGGLIGIAVVLASHYFWQV